MIYQTDGQIYSARTAAELVRQLHETSMAPAESDFAWMQEVAERTQQVTGYVIRTATPAQFVHDMTRAGVLKRLTEYPKQIEEQEHKKEAK